MSTSTIRTLLSLRLTALLAEHLDVGFYCNGAMRSTENTQVDHVPRPTPFNQFFDYSLKMRGLLNSLYSVVL